MLGRPRRDGAEYGDVVLTRGGLGIYLDYAILGVSEALGEIVRESVPDGAVIAWSVGSG